MTKRFFLLLVIVFSVTGVKAQQTNIEDWDGMWHVWQALGDLIPENKKTFEEIGQFVQSR